MTDFINNFCAIHHFVKGVLSDGKGEYTLTFVQDPDERWYIDMPWDGNRANLEMVAGADDLLSYLDTEGKHSVTIHVVPYPLRHGAFLVIDKRSRRHNVFFSLKQASS